MQADRITQALYVPIDVGKNVHCYAAYVGAQLDPLIPPQEVRTHRPGYAQFRTWLRQQVHAQCYAPIIVGLEPTGVYHEPWAYALQRDFGDRIVLQMVNPFRTKQKRRQLQNRAEHKSDAIDVAALGHCLRDGSGRPFYLPSLDLQSLELWCKRHQRLKRDRQRLANRLASQLDRLWPGALVDVAAFERAHPRLEPPEPLVHTQPLERKLVQTLLRVDANPYSWQRLSVAQIQTRLREAGLRCGPKTAHKVWRIVQHALLPPPDTAQLLAEQLSVDVRRYAQLCVELADLRTRAEILLRASPGAVVATVPGISDFLAAQYLGLVADVRRFAHADQVWALVGFDIVQDDSGDRRRRGRITKRGQPYGRAVLYQMGLSASLACAAIGRAKQRARQRGKSKIEATLHAAHKTNRICFHLYQHGVPFDPHKSR
jgi:transposase